LEWLKREINTTRNNRSNIVPRFTGQLKPKLIEILKWLPRTNCRECGGPTCMVFAARVAEGVKGAGDCIKISGENHKNLQKYMYQFCFDW
jgi:ArsR family metal-binding transcriptional regulator